MADFDLIPASYRQRQRLRVLLLVVLTAYAATLALGGAGLGSLRGEVRALRTETNRVRAGRLLADNLAGELDAVRAGRDRDGALLAALERLRAGPSPQGLFVVIDRALNDGIWLSRWQYQRATLEGDDRPAETPEPAARVAIEVPGENAVFLADRLEIAGSARSHADLGRFVDGLLGAAAVVDVRIAHSALRPAAGVVEFTLEATLDGHGAGQVDAHD